MIWGGGWDRVLMVVIGIGDERVVGEERGEVEDVG
jgi:hypothetical protein